RAAITPALPLDPVARLAIPLRALSSIAEPSQAKNRRLVFLEIEPADHDPDRVIGQRGQVSGIGGGEGAGRIGGIRSHLAIRDRGEGHEADRGDSDYR